MGVNEFYLEVYELVKLVPKGRVSTYGAIANALGRLGAARQVGYALNCCPPEVPAHRIVNSKGQLSAKLHFGGDNMQLLLQHDGVMVKNDTVVNFQTVFWDPAVEIL